MTNLVITNDCDWFIPISAEKSHGYHMNERAVSWLFEEYTSIKKHQNNLIIILNSLK